MKMENAMSDPNPLATGPTKWRAEHCTTHHHGCDCHEWEHAEKVEQLEADAEDYREAMGELVGRLQRAESEYDALRERLRVDVAELVECRAVWERARVVVEVFEALGRTRSVPEQMTLHKRCEAAMVALKEAVYGAAAQENGHE